MCTVSVEVDDKLIKEVLPELENMVAIRRWAQLLIDEHIKSLAEEYETMDLEEARAMTLAAVQEEYAKL